jgi:hypothetical protein
MSYVVTLLDYAPPERSDGIPYVSASIEEGGSPEGPWAVIDVLAIVPAENPAEPEAANLTTDNATLAEGWYRVSWIDRVGGESAPSAPARNLAVLEGGVRPTVASVAMLLRARTKIKGGKEQGTFTALTRPTAMEVDALIEDALDEVMGKVQPVEEGQGPIGVGSPYERRVRGAVRLYAAILVETSYFPEQVKAGQSVAETYLTLYEFRIRALIAEGKAGHVQGEGGMAEGDAPADPYWTFPENEGGLIGWASRW